MTAGAVSDSFTVDRDDLRIIRALQVDPRVPFATIASVLGMSEPTVSRRYGRLRRTGVLRVTGVVDPGALGQIQYLVQLRCRPGSAAALAESLARRDDVSWVALAAAGAEVTCAVRGRSPQARDDLLGTKLPRAAAVLDLHAVVILHEFVGARGQYWEALRGSLTPEEEDRLGADGNPFTESSIIADQPPTLDTHDERLLVALTADGRASHVELASASGLTAGRAARRLQILLADRVVDIHVELSAAALGYRAQAILWLRVHPSRTTRVGRELARMPEVRYAAAVSGRDNILALVHCRTLDELYAFTSDRVGGLSGVESAETSPIHRQVKQGGALVEGERLLR